VVFQVEVFWVVTIKPHSPEDIDVKCSKLDYTNFLKHYLDFLLLNTFKIHWFEIGICDYRNNTHYKSNIVKSNKFRHHPVICPCV